jgi:hypothetical protein
MCVREILRYRIYSIVSVKELASYIGNVDLGEGEEPVERCVAVDAADSRISANYAEVVAFK